MGDSGEVGRLREELQAAQSSPSPAEATLALLERGYFDRVVTYALGPRARIDARAHRRVHAPKAVGAEALSLFFDVFATPGILPACCYFAVDSGAMEVAIAFFEVEGAREVREMGSSSATLRPA